MEPGGPTTCDQWPYPVGVSIRDDSLPGIYKQNGGFDELSSPDSSGPVWGYRGTRAGGRMRGRHQVDKWHDHDDARVQRDAHFQHNAHAQRDAHVPTHGQS